MTVIGSPHAVRRLLLLVASAWPISGLASPPDLAGVSAAGAGDAAPILERVRGAIFGDAAGAVAAVRVVYTTTLRSAEEAGEIEQRVSYLFPDGVRHEVQTPLGEQSIVLDRDGGYIAAGGRRLPLADEAVREGRRQMAHDLILLAANAGSPRLQGELLGRETIDGRACDVVGVALLGATSRLWVDAQGRVLRQSFEGKHPLTGETGEITLRYEDHAAVGGLVLPRRQILAFRSQELATIRVARVELDPELLEPEPASER